MSPFLLLPDKTLRLLAAQVNLNGTFNHTCRIQNTNHCLTFELQVERGSSETQLTIVIANEKHSLTVYDPDQNTHLVLADFIVSIADGRMDTAEPATPRVVAESVALGKLLDGQQHQQLHQLVLTGGALRLDIGLDEAVSLAVHRTRNRTGITVIIATGDTSPRTKCFTVYDEDQHCLQRLLQSLSHLAASATHAA